MQRLLAGPAACLDGFVIAEFLELPKHLWTRNCEEECSVEGLSLHPCGEVALDCRIAVSLRFVGGSLLVVAFHKAYV